MKCRIGFEPHLTSINQAFNKYFSDKQELFEFQLLNKPTWQSTGHFKVINMLYFMLTSFWAFSREYDLVHINGANFGLVAYLASFFGCQYIYTIHGCPHPEMERREGIKNSILSIISIQLMKIVSKRAIQVYTISEFSQNELARDFAIHATVIYNGYDDKMFFPKAKHQFFYNAHLEHKKVFISVGRMIEGKNPWRVIDIFTQIASHSTDCHLIFIGSGVLWAEVVAYAKQKNVFDQISFIQQVDYGEMPQYYAGCDYFISGCDMEGFGLGALEAFACGCYPLLPVAGAFPEIFQCEAFFYDSNNIDKLRLGADDDVIVGQWQGKILQKFTWANVIPQYEAVYQKILKLSQRG